ncbi:MAG: excalibur calcium-binding domain-containing protein [Frankiaceae bacterium]
MGGAPPPPALAQAPPAPAPSAAAGLDPRFPTCAAATAAGYGPYVRGIDPEYVYVDRNGDGTVC